jgi:hypothetical protein
VAQPIVLQPGLVQIKAHYRSNPDNGERPINLLWFVQRAPVSLSQANMQTICNAFDPLWSIMWEQWAPGYATYLGSEATDYSTAFGNTWSTVGTWTPTTGVKTTPLPPQVALLISLHVNERWRGGHARIYLPWGAAEAVSTTDPDMALAATTSIVSTKFGLIEPGMNSIAIGGGLSQRVYRQRTTPGSAHLMPISSYTVQTMLATQRRRLRKVPHH